MSLPPGKSKTFGFSLIEVVIALGLASFALVSMIGLLGVGFRGARDSINMTVISDISDSISADAQLTPWTNLTSSGSRFVSSTRYFDDLGRELSNQVDAAYIANVQLGTAPTNVIVPGDSATNLIVDVWAIATPQKTNRSCRLLVKSE